jgi:hypothetical protein
MVCLTWVAFIASLLAENAGRGLADQVATYSAAKLSDDVRRQ